MVKETINALPEIDHWIDKNVKKFREEIKKKQYLINLLLNTNI